MQLELRKSLWWFVPLRLAYDNQSLWIREKGPHSSLCLVDSNSTATFWGFLSLDSCVSSAPIEKEISYCIELICWCLQPAPVFRAGPSSIISRLVLVALVWCCYLVHCDEKIWAYSKHSQSTAELAQALPFVSVYEGRQLPWMSECHARCWQRKTLWPFLTCCVAAAEWQMQDHLQKSSTPQSDHKKVIPC